MKEAIELQTWLNALLNMQAEVGWVMWDLEYFDPFTPGAD